ncbi:protein bli-3 [Elsinoe australis]|uniref:Protein bli-3 n=1 Tax=Elsinoe australis TaxID=40998 RepID=A0A4U7AY43_9PEZI|nr:protein bli-3 [Elsinoe australis]
MSAIRTSLRTSTRILRLNTPKAIPTTTRTTTRTFHATSTFKMPEPLKSTDINSSTDPSVARQYDRETPTDKQISDFFGLADSLKTCLMTTHRPGVGPVSRSMAVAKRNGPDFLFLANAHSNKFSDLDKDKTIQLTFQDSSSQNWASITGKATVTDNSDPRIKELNNPFAAAWFGDLGDGVHTGKAEDPRMTLIEVKADYIAYWLSTSTKLGFLKEIAEANLTGKVATTGVNRELKQSEIEQARQQK